MPNFSAKTHQIQFRPGLRPRPRGGAYSAPRPTSWGGSDYHLSKNPLNSFRTSSPSGLNPVCAVLKKKIKNRWTLAYLGTEARGHSRPSPFLPIPSPVYPFSHTHLPLPITTPPPMNPRRLYPDVRPRSASTFVCLCVCVCVL